MDGWFELRQKKNVKRGVVPNLAAMISGSGQDSIHSTQDSLPFTVLYKRSSAVQSGRRFA